MCTNYWQRLLTWRQKSTKEEKRGPPARRGALCSHPPTTLAQRPAPHHTSQRMRVTTGFTWFLHIPFQRHLNESLDKASVNSLEFSKKSLSVFKVANAYVLECDVAAGGRSSVLVNHGVDFWKGKLKCVLAREDPVPWLGRSPLGALATPPRACSQSRERPLAPGRTCPGRGRTAVWAADGMGSSGQGPVLAERSTDRRLSLPAAGGARREAERKALEPCLCRRLTLGEHHPPQGSAR